MPLYQPTNSQSLDSTAYNTPAFTVTRTNSDTSALGPTITALFKNTGDASGGSDYQNEAHLRLQAGGTADHRRYFNIAGYDGVDDWLTGGNAKNVWILYDANSNAHRMWAETSDSGNSPNNTGHTYINSAGSGSIIFNGLNDGGNNIGSGGMALYGGGAGTPTRVFQVDGNGNFGFVGAISSRFTGYISGTLSGTAGSSIGGLLVQPTHAPSDNSTLVFNGINVNPQTSGTNTFTTVYGFNSTATHLASAGITTLAGGYFSAQNSVVQTVANAYGIQCQIQQGAAGTITTAYGVYVLAPTNSGSITNYNGVRVLDFSASTLTTGLRSSVTSGTGKWNLYIDGSANNHVLGNVALGSTTAPTAFLDVAAGTTAKAQIRLRSSTAPSAPNDGDIWYDGTDLKIRLGGVTKTVTVA